MYVCRTAVRTVSRPRRSAPFEAEPGFYEPAQLWLYGNARLLASHLAQVFEACGPSDHSPVRLDAIEREAEDHVLASKVLVCGVHSPAHQRAAIVPLRWGSPRIVVFSGGFQYHLGKDLMQEPFPAGCLWRERWDPRTDLAVSRRAPDRLPTYATHNPTVDRLIKRLVLGESLGLLGPDPSASFHLVERH